MKKWIVVLSRKYGDDTRYFRMNAHRKEQVEAVLKRRYPTYEFTVLGFNDFYRKLRNIKTLKEQYP